MSLFLFNSTFAYIGNSIRFNFEKIIYIRVLYEPLSFGYSLKKKKKKNSNVLNSEFGYGNNEVNGTDLI